MTEKDLLQIRAVDDCVEIHMDCKTEKDCRALSIALTDLLYRVPYVGSVFIETFLNYDNEEFRRSCISNTVEMPDFNQLLKAKK